MVINVTVGENLIPRPCQYFPSAVNIYQLIPWGDSNTGCWMLDTGYWMLDACNILSGYDDKALALYGLSFPHFHIFSRLMWDQIFPRLIQFILPYNP